MKNSELKEYLNTFPDDAPVSVIIANPRKRKLYECVDAFGVTGEGQPIFCIDVGEEKDMDAEMVQHAKMMKEMQRTLKVRWTLQISRRCCHDKRTI